MLSRTALWVLKIAFDYSAVTGVAALIVFGISIYFVIRFFYLDNQQPPEGVDDGLSDSLDSSFFLDQAELKEIDYNIDFNEICADLPPEWFRQYPMLACSYDTSHDARMCVIQRSRQIRCEHETVVQLRDPANFDMPQWYRYQLEAELLRIQRINDFLNSPDTARVSLQYDFPLSMTENEEREFIIQESLKLKDIIAEVSAEEDAFSVESAADAALVADTAVDALVVYGPGIAFLVCLFFIVGEFFSYGNM